MMLSVLPVVGLVGASNLSTAIIILGIAVILDFCGKSEICAVYMDGGDQELDFWRVFLGLGKLSAGAACNLAKSGEV